eukprot:CAMPEP_0197238832 /NCGR_PEP_ID=MMETSP1429-20130617/5339_1 /TAXON_ID=49237 /ORGANISM="Chaetoceros  sp., Strain UNC1202" /LENGTH=680 /DNA_ID=CAMNT_0042698099 /DNA_START=25 /DNA_END=2067 /DNA_ORIENTATION=+
MAIANIASRHSKRILQRCAINKPTRIVIGRRSGSTRTCTHRILIGRAARSFSTTILPTSNQIQTQTQIRSNRKSSIRYFATDDGDGDTDEDDVMNAERESMPFDVLIVGGGPSGLAASIRLKQLCEEKDIDLSVCVMEKGSEIGAHILSGNVFDPKALEELLPTTDWKEELAEIQSSVATPVQKDDFLLLTETSSYEIPSVLLPSQLHNDGNYVISLGQLCRYLATKAEEMGVEVYPGFAASEVLFNDDQTAVRGIATRDMGIDKDGKPKDTFERGVELHARQTLFAEGARGSCSEELIEHFKLREGKSAQTYGLGVKEVWEVPEENFKSGLVQHTLGYPLQSKWNDETFGGTFLYHQEPNLVHAGIVIGLDYANPHINPYKEFQKWKTHPDIKKHFEGGTCISYGARVLNEGGLHSIPKLTFKGGALIGCSAGFLNSVKIKGSHTAIKSGAVAAESVFDALTADAEVEPVSQTFEIDPAQNILEATCFEERMEKSWVHEELYEVRNTHEAFARWGFLPGLAYAGLAAHVTKGREPWTFSHQTRDADKTKEARNFEPISYLPADGVLTFDLLTNLQRSGTYHDDNQEAHLRVKQDLSDIPLNVSMQMYEAPEQRFCPAGVYEYVTEEKEEGGEDSGSCAQKLVINAQNCVHCKCCSIKMPGEYINWTVPEGGGGPNYQVM